MNSVKFAAVALAAAIALPTGASAVTTAGFLSPGDGNNQNVGVFGFISGSATSENLNASGAPNFAEDFDGVFGSITAIEDILVQNFSITVNPASAATNANPDPVMISFDGVASGGGDISGLTDGDLSFTGTSAIFPNSFVLMAGDVLNFTLDGSGVTGQPTFINFTGLAVEVPVPPAALLLLAGLGGLVVMRRKAV
ncbi:MAG: VPLPA-CTERM sorting domain-containing protein [Pseudomonadota bacterium]